jgi:ribosomal protein S18 acetylase RimI-like enzyme
MTEHAVHLRAATLADFRQVTRWIPDRASCRRWAGPAVRWSRAPETLARRIGLRPDNGLALLVDGRLAGFAQRLTPRPGIHHVTRVIVAPDRRREGLGRALALALKAEAAASGARRLSLYVYRDNRRALRLYRALGWRPRRPHRLPLPRGLCYMVMDLSGRRAG